MLILSAERFAIALIRRSVRLYVHLLAPSSDYSVPAFSSFYFFLFFLLIKSNKDHRYLTDEA